MPGPIGRPAVRRAARSAVAAAAAGAALLTAAGCRDSGGGAAAASEGDAAAHISWGAHCPGLGPLASKSPRKGQVRCGTLKVPLDYRHPHGAQLTLAVSRLSAAKPGKRRGVLLTNPGGPGNSGLEQGLELDAMGVPSSVFDAYDVIGVDPRGVGRSSPLSCGFKDPAAAMVPVYARTSKDVDRAARISRSEAKACRTRNGSRLRHFTTANTARDLDRVRAALGVPKISYYGLSYGTYLGAVYASLFPGRTDRMVLDSSLGPDYGRPAMRHWGLGMELRFPDFETWAAARNSTYHLGSTPEQVRGVFQLEAAALYAKPVQTMDESAFRFLVQQGMAADFQFPATARFLKGVKEHDGPAIGKAVAEIASAGGIGGGKPDPSVPKDNGAAAGLSVMCGDGNYPQGSGVYRHDVPRDRAAYPLYGAAAANVMPCAYWPPAHDRVRIGGSAGARNILMVQNLRDPATVAPDAFRMRRTLGARARMVTVDQGGHGVYGVSKNRCGNGAVTRWLADGKLPGKDTRCR